ncbi:hypothetical protein Tsubulata_045975 [Turnera subulata]|uniref:Uncharacterized protein n=1 Tax=Turnera subulata TaxID=218843 RepID=A0A9Q0G8F5_9ROSI|nr:hypothetical protein Tsubulata_051594 [Turnera subulata]KAJ4845078.1 hypothetical protein Tsubulata_045975 [Turnera subulata]
MMKHAQWRQAGDYPQKKSWNILECLQSFPFCHITQFSGIQAILGNVTEAKKIHIIDLSIKSGLQWPILMQAPVSRQENPFELLKITAIWSCSKEVIEDAVKRLKHFAS